MAHLNTVSFAGLAGESCASMVHVEGPAIGAMRELDREIMARHSPENPLMDESEYEQAGVVTVRRRAPQQDQQRLGACCQFRWDDLLTRSPSYTGVFLNDQLVEETLLCHSAVGMGGMLLFPVLAGAAVLLLLLVSNKEK